jgi:glycosyltransferase involved in cell wall biosynthesis
VRTFHGSALHEARTANRLRRKLAQGLTFALEILASRLATGTYSLTSGQGRPYAVRGTLPNAVAIPDRVSIERDGAPKILFVGAWAGRKRGELLHRVFRQEVLPSVPGAELHMVSDSCEPGPNVHWWRRPSDAELYDLYREAWAFCLPSSYEGFGLPYAEAMAHAVPVVTSPNPGAEEVVSRGNAGLVVEDQELGPALIRLLTDTSLRRELAARGRARVQNFSWAATVKAHESAYNDAIERWSDRRRPSGAQRP